MNEAFKRIRSEIWYRLNSLCKESLDWWTRLYQDEALDLDQAQQTKDTAEAAKAAWNLALDCVFDAQIERAFTRLKFAANLAREYGGGVPEEAAIALLRTIPQYMIDLEPDCSIRPDTHSTMTKAEIAEFRQYKNKALAKWEERCKEVAAWEGDTRGAKVARTESELCWIKADYEMAMGEDDTAIFWLEEAKYHEQKWNNTDLAKKAIALLRCMK